MRIFINNRGHKAENGFVEILSKSASEGLKQTSKKRLCHSVQINGNSLFQRISTEPRK